jgi:hypothetical protein
MEQVTKISEKAVGKYFNILSKSGYKKYNDVNKLLVLLFIEELLDSQDFLFYIDEKDYRTITNALYCLYGKSCMIDFPTYAVFDSIVHSTKSTSKPRITEDSILRSTQDIKIRIV